MTKNVFKLLFLIPSLIFAQDVTESSSSAGNELYPNTEWYYADTSATEFTISTEAELAGLAELVNGTEDVNNCFDFYGKTIKLVDNINLSGYNWTSIGEGSSNCATNSKLGFYGTFNGNGYVVSGFNGELFNPIDQIDYVRVLNLGVEGGKIIATENIIHNSYERYTIGDRDTVIYYNAGGDTVSLEEYEGDTEALLAALRQSAANENFKSDKPDFLDWDGLEDFSDILAEIVTGFDGDGNEENPYIIKTVEQLITFRDLVNTGMNFENKFIELGDNINLNGSYEAQWTPIGNSISNPFAGTFNGNGYEIKGLHIESEELYQGLFGNATGTIENLGVYGDVIGSTGAGGIVGGNNSSNSNSTIINSYFIGSVLVRNAEKSVIGCGNAYNSHFNGAIVEEKTVSPTTENTWDTLYINSALNNVSAKIGEVRYYNAWSKGVPYPTLKPNSIAKFDAKEYYGTKGTSEDPHKITNKDELIMLATIVNDFEYSFENEYVRLDTNIVLNEWNVDAEGNIVDLEGIPVEIDGEYVTLQAIGTNVNPFKGSFDGNGKIIRGMYINVMNNFQGLFGYAPTGEIKNLGVIGLVNTGDINNDNVSTSDYIGGIAGVAKKISNSYFIGNIYGNNVVGGIAGSANVENSYYVGTVTGIYPSGGIIGTGSAVNSFYSEDFIVPPNEYGDAKSSEEMQSPEFLAVLQNYAANANANSSANFTSWTIGNSENPYPIHGGNFDKLDITPVLHIANIKEGKELNPIILGNSGKGKETIYYKSLSDTEADYTAEIPTEKGLYLAYAVIEDTGIYKKDSTEKVMFAITVKEPELLTVNWSNQKTFTYNGNEQYPSATVNGVALIVAGGVDAGKYTAVASFADSTLSVDYELANNEKDFEISPKRLGTYAIDPIRNYVWTGSQVIPLEEEIIVRDGVTILIKDVDYNVSYEKNIDPGLGYVYVSGIGNYTNSSQITFPITKENAQPIKVDWANATTEFEYDGTEKYPEPVMKYGDVEIKILGGQSNAGTFTAIAHLKNPEVDTDFFLTEASQSYTIKPKKLNVKWEEEPELGYLYNKKIQTPAYTIVDESDESYYIPEKELTVTPQYSEEGIYTGDKAPTLIITSSNADNFEFIDNSNKIESFEIQPRPLIPFFNVPVNNLDYTSKEGEILVPEELFDNMGLLKDILTEFLNYKGFQTDGKITDDKSILSGDAEISIQEDEAQIPLLGLFKRVETTRTATATVNTDNVSVKNYKPQTTNIRIIATVDVASSGEATFCRKGDYCTMLGSGDFCKEIGGEEVPSCDDIRVSCFIDGVEVTDMLLSECRGIGGTTPILNGSSPFIANNAPVYFNLKGVQVEHLTPGIYIEKRGSQVKKIMVR